MSLTVEDDFREFVAACWPDLESAALLVMLDPESARRVTTDALADLHHRWREAVDEGVPAALAKGAVLTAAVGGATSAPPPSSPESSTSGWDHTGTRRWGDDDGADDRTDAVVDALVAVLRAASPLERAVVAGRSVWAMEPAEVAQLLGVAAGSVRNAASSLHARLVAAHDAAREAEGLPPAGWALERDVEDAVEVLLRGVTDPPDPAALVTERSRVVRRRSLLVAGAGAVVLAGGGVWWLRRDERTSPRVPTSAAATMPGPDDPRWSRTTTWYPRGALANDVAVQALVLARTASGSRLLWADDVGDRRLVVAVALDYTLSPGSELRVWQGPRGAEPGALEDSPLALTTIEGVRDVVALTLPQGFRGLGRSASTLVVLSRPTVRSASFSRLVRPTPAGTIERHWVELPLVEGVAATVLQDPVSAAMRVRLAGFDGPPATTEPLWMGREIVDVAPEPFTRAIHGFVERVTGIPAARLRTEVVADSPVSGSIIDPTAMSATDGDGRVVALRTITPEGAVLSSVAVRDDGRARGGTVVLRQAVVVLADHADDPVVERVADLREQVGRYLVVASGAASVQLVGTSQTAYPISKVVATKGQAAAVVPVVDADDAAGLRVITRDASGGVTFDGVPAGTRVLLDLWS